MVWPQTYISDQEQRSFEGKSFYKSTLDRSTESQVEEEWDWQWTWNSLQALNEAWQGAQQLPPESCQGWDSNNTTTNIWELQTDSFQMQKTPLQGRAKFTQLGSEGKEGTKKEKL